MICFTGSIGVHRVLDREDRAFYNLTVSAMDLSSNGVLARCFVSIDVDDVNDNPPRFLKPVYRGCVSEAASVGTSVLQVRMFLRFA